MSVNSYENVKQCLEEKGCKLLDTEDEFKIIKEQSKKTFKINYIASCGHQHKVFYNVFKSRGTGLVCANCKNKSIGNIKKEKIANNEISKIKNTETEFAFIQKFIKMTESHFEIKKAFDGCSVDIIFKPKNIINDEWVGIQVKTNETIHLTYSFHIKNHYKNCLILLYSCQDESMWLIPENIIGNQKKLSIGLNKSKYNIYKIQKEELTNKLTSLYNSTTKFEFNKLDTPNNIYQQREKEFRKYREEVINFIPFIYDGMEGTVYDFKINNLKVQEKVFSKSKEKGRLNSYVFNISKCDLISSRNRKHGQYSIGDNDIYWINCENKKEFFVIPEQVLIDKGYVGNKDETIHFRVNPEKLSKQTNWLEPYLFNYETINIESNKEKLLTICQIK